MRKEGWVDGVEDSVNGGLFCEDYTAAAAGDSDYDED